jgi:hypothetical protein
LASTFKLGTLLSSQESDASYEHLLLEDFVRRSDFLAFELTRFPIVASNPDEVRIRRPEGLPDLPRGNPSSLQHPGDSNQALVTLRLPPPRRPPQARIVTW